MQTSSRNGFGTKLLFHRPAGEGLFEATVWFMAFFIPIFPRSTWLVRPRGVQTQSAAGHVSTTFDVEFVERRKTSLARVGAMYLGVVAAVVAMWGPLILFFVIQSYNPGMEKTWAGALILVPLVWAVALWIILDLRREKLYQQAAAAEAAASGKS